MLVRQLQASQQRKVRVDPKEEVCLQVHPSRTCTCGLVASHGLWGSEAKATLHGGIVAMDFEPTREAWKKSTEKSTEQSTGKVHGLLPARF